MFGYNLVVYNVDSYQLEHFHSTMYLSEDSSYVLLLINNHLECGRTCCDGVLHDTVMMCCDGML